MAENGVWKEAKERGGRGTSTQSVCHAVEQRPTVLTNKNSFAF